MKYATFRTDGSDFEPSRAIIEKAGAWWVRFGDDVLTYAANDRWSEVEGRFSVEQRSARQPAGEVRKGAMHLVVQKGRTFQQAHPEVEVIFDRGRYLVVSLSKAEAKTCADHDGVCFDVAPLAENQVVFDTAAPARRTEAGFGAAAEIVARVDQARFEAHIAQLVSYPTRLSTSDAYAEAAAYCRAQLAAAGYTVEMQEVPVPGGVSSNVVARKPGVATTGRGEVLVVAHLDSINAPGGPSAAAPGADDNASGSAGVLVLAEALAGHALAHDLVLILFGGEEQGLHGSTHYVAGLDESARDRVRAVLNMDMIGSVNALPPSVLLEGHPTSQSMIEALAQAAADFTTLAVQTSLNPFASDHVPFIQGGMPAVLTIEGADGANEAIHTSNDTLDRISADFAVQILRMNAGFVAEAAGAVRQTPEISVVSPPPGVQPPPGVMPPPAAVPPQPAGHPPQGYAMPPGPPLAHPAQGGFAPQPAPAGPAGPADPQIARQLAFHYQALLAQYARLGRDGHLTAQDYGQWQTTRAAYETVAAKAGGCGCGCGGHGGCG